LARLDGNRTAARVEILRSSRHHSSTPPPHFRHRVVTTGSYPAGMSVARGGRLNAAEHRRKKGTAVELLNGVHHVTSLTADLDQLIDFYRRVFGARVTLDLEEEGLRHAFIRVGPETVLHPFQVPGAAVQQGRLPMFGRGRLDHVAVNAASEEAFWELRRRVEAEGVADGDVIDMGSLLNFGFVDPDGTSHEVVWAKTGVPVEQGIRRTEWTTVGPG
jgi:catechol 2,3-dioxygenase-like lactoylglutathione lyase family enzyme